MPVTVDPQAESPETAVPVRTSDCEDRLPSQANRQTPGVCRLPLTRLRPEEVREPQAEIPAVAAVTEPSQGTGITREPFVATLPPFIFSGALLGLLPMFNSAVFLAAAAVLGVLFLLFSLRGQMLVLAITAGVIALPQMLYLSTGSGRAQMPKLLHWGYTIDHPTFENVTKYLGFTFGFKWALIALALIFATSCKGGFFWHFESPCSCFFFPVHH